MEKEMHVIFGAGQVGVTLANILLASGKSVRMVKHSPGGVPTGIELLLGVRPMRFSVIRPVLVRQRCITA